MRRTLKTKSPKPPMPLSLTVQVERWPIAGTFTIARGSRTEAVVVVAQVSDGASVGRGECTPYARYGETAEGVAATIDSMRERLAAGMDRSALQDALPAGAPRNALDCALWDLEAKRSGRRAYQLAGLSAPRSLTTAYTISLGAPEAMAEAAARVAGRSLLKVKLGAPGDVARIRAVRAAAPHAALIVDANEGWRTENLAENFAACAEAGVTLIEQPLPAADDDALARYRAADPGVRRRERARPRVARRAARPLRRHQHQARQNRRAHRSAGPRCKTRASSASRSWSAAWWRLRWRWRRRCWLRKVRASSISTVRCCWPKTGRRACVTTAASCIRPSLRSGVRRARATGP